MMKIIKLLLVLFFFYVINSSFASWFSSDQKPLLINQPFPTFEQTDLSLQLQTEGNFLGHWSLVTVWGTWCGYCRQEHSFLLSLNERNQTSINKTEIQLVGIDYQDNRQEAINYLNQAGNPFLYSIFDPNGQLASKLGVQAVPAHFLVNPQGIIVYHYLGALNRSVWDSKLVPLFSGFKF